jgi:transglutaminase-like putative cysteine protease
MDMLPFLAPSAAIDIHHPSVRRLAKIVCGAHELETVQAAYELVRDRFAHTYDIGAAEISVSASDVIRYGHGICFAKAHLLAGLLSTNGIPAGLCYQKLARDCSDNSRGTVLHGLNAVWLDGKWHRLDPRGNTPNTAAPFEPGCERLAHDIDVMRGERDYHDVVAEPLPSVVAVLRDSRNVAELDRNLPLDRD